MPPVPPAVLLEFSALFAAPQPVFARRGFMLDVSRCRVPTMETLQHLVGLLAALRYNELQLYTEHTFAYRGHEVVWRDASPLTPDEIRTLDGWCRAAGLELVPNQNSLGHLERWLKHAPYRPLAEALDGFTTPWGEFRPNPSTLCPGPAAEALLADLYAQLLPHFTSRRLNVGCDEPFELGQGASRAACATRGRPAVFLDHLAAVHRLAAAHGRTIEFWADVIFEEGANLTLIPADAHALIWGYEAVHPFHEQCARVASTGRSFTVCPGDSTWCSLGGRLHTARANLANAASAARDHGATGLLLTHWGDWGHWQPWATLLPGLILAATAAWDGAPCADAALATALNQLAADVTGRFGPALLALGRLDRLHRGNPANRSLLWEALFKDATYLRLSERLAAVAPSAWPAVASEVARLTAEFAACEPAHDAGRTLVAEARFSVAMLRAALDRVPPLLAGTTPPAATWTPTAEALLAEHSRLWAHRSRPGGLSESCAYLPRG